MSKNESQPKTMSEHAYRRGGKLIESFANKKVRRYDTFDPRLVIDLPKKGDKIIVDKFSPFETGINTDIDRVEIIRGHHKARLLFSFGKTSVEDGDWKHEVLSPDGLVGYAYGEKLDYYLASCLHNDERLLELAKGHGRFDEMVEEYLERELKITGLFKV